MVRFFRTAIVSAGLCLFVFVGGLAQSAASKQTAGYNIPIQIKPYKNQWVYLAYYYGSIKALADSAYLNPESKGIFKGSKALPQGVYIIASPSKTILVEMLMGKDQDYSIVFDTTNIDGTLKYAGSPDNDQFLAYTSYIAPRARKIDSLRKQMDTAAEANKAHYRNQMQQPNFEIANYRKKVMQQYPESMLGILFNAMKEIELPPDLRKPVTHEDSVKQYRYAKEHYWDGVDFMDGRLVRTPVFENKMDDYLQNWVAPAPDSVIYEFNWMIALGRNDADMFKYLIGYFVDHYMYPKIMGQDKVFLHVYQQYLAGDKPKVDWLNEKQMKIIRERAYMLMANQIGAKAWNMELPDTGGKINSLYNLKATYTVVAFWDVHCGKCREEIPRMDTIYRTDWKGHDVKIYAVMVNEASIADWKPYINEHCAGWTHVHQTDAMRAAEEKEGKPNFRQLYDMRSTPTLFLLDKDKNIIAKNLSLNDLDKILKQKFAQ